MRRLAGGTLLLFVCLTPTAVRAQRTQPTPNELAGLSLEELMNLKVITAGKYPQEAWKSPSTLSVIQGAELRAYGHRTLADALKTVVGSIPSEDGARTYLGFRGVLEPGTFNSRVLWMLDGHVLNESYFQWAFPDEQFGITIADIERIEIVRGPASVLYGSNAFIAAVNVVTRSGAGLGGLEVSLHGEARRSVERRGAGEATSFGQIGGGVRLGKRYGPDEDLLLSTSFLDSRGGRIFIPYFTASGEGGVAERVDSREAKTLLARYARGGLRLTARYVDAEYGRPMADYGATPNHRDNRSSERSFFSEARYERQLGDRWHAVARAYYDDTDFTGRWHYEGFDRLDRQHVPSRWFGLEAQASLDTGRHRLQGGFEYQNHRTSQTEDYPSEARFNHDEYGFSNYGVYVQEEFEISDRSRINLGARYEDNEIYGGIAIARAALIYHPGADVFRLQVGDGFKNILLHDYLYRSSVSGRRQDEIARLRRERARTVEAAWSRTFDRVRLELTAFRSHVDDIVKYDPGEDHYLNGQGVTSVGLEGELRLSSSWLNGYLNGIYQETTEDDGKSPALNSPPYSLKLGALRPILKPARLSVAFEGQYYGATDYVDHESRPRVDLRQDGYVVFNLNLRSEGWVAGFECALGIFNLLDAYFEYPVSKGVRQSFPSPGREARLTLSYRF